MPREPSKYIYLSSREDRAVSKFYKPYSDDRLICTLCQHYCKIKKNQTGICGVNKNIGDKIECLVYGYPSALAIDPIEKKPLYHFLPSSKAFSLGTVGCNFRCSFCQNWQISQSVNIDKSRYFSPEDIVRLAIENSSASIAYTYNEPTIFYLYARDIALQAKEHSIKSIFVTNGYESKEVVDDMVGIIDGANIDLKSFNPSYYKKNLGGNLQKVLDTIKQFVKNGIWVEITTLIVPSQNDSEEELRDIANFIAKELGVHIPWHISAFHPDYKEQNLPRTSIEMLQRAYDIGKEAGLHYIYMGNIGVENPTNCPKCHKTVIQREYFGVTKNSLIDGKCPSCGYKIEGVFQ
ncbi:MAG: AmmeMemoRadiSam system radical SAM enzyme [Epsilonproteobacteria bacterium]|nr:AmmeMemoRadiSam system radical SAM enzyme [Campylobacterota bacterium]